MSDIIKLDSIDWAILRELQADAAQSVNDLGEKVGLSTNACWRRTKRLEEAGVRAGRRVEVVRAALGFGVTVFLGVYLATRGRVPLEDFERAVGEVPVDAILADYHLAGFSGMDAWE